MDGEVEVRHCCEMMTRELADERVPITFSPRFREYALQLSGEPGSVSIIDEISYCPWCGRSLPSSLRDQWFDAVLAEFPGFELFDEPPAEFADARWWLERGL